MRVLVLVVLVLAFAELLREWLSDASWLAQVVGAIVFLFVFVQAALMAVDLTRDGQDRES